MKELTNKKMQVDDFVNLVKNNREELFTALNEKSFDHIKVSDIFAKHLGFDQSPKIIGDDELDSLIKFGKSVEISRGFGTEDVLSSFISGKSGFGSYDEGGAGHYFAMETLSDEQASKMGLNLDLTKRGGQGPSMSYQASHYAGSQGKTMLRAGLPADAKIARRADIYQEIENVRQGREGELTSLRKQIVDSQDNDALKIFDGIFNPKVQSEYSSSIASMVMRI
jgi:hypothetical protein